MTCRRARNVVHSVKWQLGSRIWDEYSSNHLHVTSVNPACPAFLVAVAYARLVMANSTSPMSIWPRTGNGRLPTPVLRPGTLCLTVSRTLINLTLQTFKRDFKTSFFHILTNLARWRFFFTKTRYINSLLLLLLFSLLLIHLFHSPLVTHVSIRDRHLFLILLHWVSVLRSMQRLNNGIKVYPVSQKRPPFYFWITRSKIDRSW